MKTKRHSRKFINAAFKQATRGSYTMYGCCLKEPVMTQVAIDRAMVPLFQKWVAKTQFIWRTWMCAFCENSAGKYTKIEIHETPRQMNSDEASEYMTSRLHDLISSVPSDHFVSSGYVNTYNDADLDGSSDDLVEMFDNYGAFNLDHCLNLHTKKLIVNKLG